MTTPLPHLAPDGSFRNVPERPAATQNAPQSPVPPEPDWITVLDAQERFRMLGLPRSAEAIRKYCRQNKLEAEIIAGPKGDQHMIRRDSIDTFVETQLKVIEAATRSIPVRDGTTRNIPVHSVSYRNDPEQPGTARSQDTDAKVKDLTEEIERLKRVNRDLEIDKEVRTRMNDMLEKNNDRLIAQVREVSKEAQEWSRKFGQLEERVMHLQLKAPEPSPESEAESASEGAAESAPEVAATRVADTPSAPSMATAEAAPHPEPVPRFTFSHDPGDRPYNRG